MAKIRGNCNAELRTFAAGLEWGFCPKLLMARTFGRVLGVISLDTTSQQSHQKLLFYNRTSCFLAADTPIYPSECLGFQHGDVVFDRAPNREKVQQGYPDGAAGEDQEEQPIRQKKITLQIGFEQGLSPDKHGEGDGQAERA
jgi:hypothetical protein